MQVPDSNFTIKAPRGHQPGNSGVEGHAPGRSSVAHQRVEALPGLHLSDVDVVVDVGGRHQSPAGGTWELFSQQRWKLGERRPKEESCCSSKKIRRWRELVSFLIIYTGGLSLVSLVSLTCRG